MLQIKDIMQREVVAVAPELTLREMVEVLTEHGVSGAPVVAAGVVIGVSSATDILTFQEDAPSEPREAVEGPMPGRGEDSEPASEFFSQMWEPSEIDALDRMSADGSFQWDRLREHTVSDVMTRRIVSRPSDTSVGDAARYMLEAGVHRLLVIDGGNLEGIVTTTDIVRAVAEGKLTG